LGIGRGYGQNIQPQGLIDKMLQNKWLAVI
jgi:hypothetical protein